MASAANSGPNISSLVDPIFYGALVSIALTWIYIHNNDDKWPLQTMVGFLSLMVFGCTVLDGLILHHYFVDNFGNPIELIHVTPEFSIFTLFTLIIIVTSDLMFASRLWRLKRVHWALITVVVLTAIGALIPGIMLVNGLFNNPYVLALNSPSPKIEVGFINILAGVSQCISTVALWWSFRAHMRETVAPFSSPCSIVFYNYA
ncbi:hypothetical protein MPER_10994, partial [Moniliophthora perniciosa FA553]